MPWTVSHTAAVLPLRRFTPEPLDFAAFVFGSMAPDLGYYINAFDFATYAHSPAGSVCASLPTALVFLVLCYLTRSAVVYTFPAPHRQALAPLCGKFPSGFRRWAMIVGSALLGIWIHIFWDAWTHDTGWFVEHIAALRRPVFHIGKNIVYLPLFLQFLCTVLGFIVVVVAYLLWLRHQRRAVTTSGERDGWRYLFWLGVAVAAVILGIALAFVSARGKHGYLLGRAIMFRTAVYGSDVAVPLGVIGALIIARGRRRK